MRAFGFACIVFLCGCAAAPPAGLEQIQTVVVIYAENRSFDHLYGLFPGAEGIANATAGQKTQLDHDGSALPYLPPVYVGGKASAAFPDRLPNGPFRIDPPPVNRRLSDQLPNPIHPYYQNREQINGGPKNKFVATTHTAPPGLGHFYAPSMKNWAW